MKKLLLHIILFVTLVGGTLHAQQFPLTTQYLFNPYALNPAMAGYFGYAEIHLNYRREWVNIPEGPKTFRINGFASIYQDKMWLGGEIYSDKTGAFSTFKASISYSYILQTGDNQQLFFGVWGNYFQNSFNVANATGFDPNDPLFQGRSTVNGSVFNAGFGIDYNWNDLNIGFAFPNAFTDNKIPNTTTPDFNMQRELLFHVSNLFYLTDHWQILGSSVVRKTKNEPLLAEVSSMAIFNQQFWSGITYRNSGIVAINIGGYIAGGILFNYAYETGIAGASHISGGTHEITLSFRLGMQGSNYFEKKGRNRNGRSRIKRHRKYERSRPWIMDY